MLSFESDYVEGAHELILKRLMETNLEQLSGYGADPYCAQAKEKIREACECPDADIYFLVGGTQTNQTVIDGMLASYEGVIAAETGHEASMRRVPSNIPATKSSPFPSTKARFVQTNWSSVCVHSGKTKATNIWYFPAWSIFPIQRNMAHSIHAQNWNISLPSVKPIKSLFIWMEPDSATDL